MKRIKAFLLLTLIFGMTLSPVTVLSWNNVKSLYGTTDSCFKQISKDSHENEANSSDPHDLQPTSQDNGLKNPARNWSAPNREFFGPPFVDRQDRWNSHGIDKWSDFARVDEDSTELIVGVSEANPNSYTELMDLIVGKGGKPVNTVSIREKVRAVVVDVPLETVSSFTAEVRASGLSRYVEPNMKYQATLVPNDPYWPNQWGPKKIEAEWAWDTTTGNRSIIVAVIDTGIDYDHPDLAANYVALGYDWVNNDTDPMDDHGHGTHCAGIIAAVINNGKGIAGLAQVRIMAEKVLESGGWGYWEWVASGIIHAVDQGADIISMSLGGYTPSELVHDAVKYAYDAGVLVVAAAGNDAWSRKLYPAAYNEVIAVTATEEADNPASFTNFGEWVELAAPGVGIYSTVWDNSYTYMSGTSMATPHVSGVAALVWSRFQNMSRDWVRIQLRRTADDLGDLGFDIYYGYGRVNARRAVEETVAHELLVLDLERPPYVEPGGSAVINGTILNFGINNEVNVTAQLLVNGTIVNSTSISSIAGGASVKVGCSWNPLIEGLYNVTFYVVPVAGENVTWDNVKSAYIGVGYPLKAFVLDSAGTDLDTSTWEELNTNWYKYGGELIYIDYKTLNIDGITYSDIAATDADVLIISCAYDWEFTDSEIEAITQYVHEGHGLIATAGTLYYGVPNNNKLAPLFGLNETTTWYSTGTDLLDILNLTHPLFVNVPNPLVIPYVATVIPSDGRWDSNELVGGTYVALGHSSESAIVAYRRLVFISPWLENIPAYYRHHLQLFYNAITWSKYEKPEHELTVSLDCPAYLKPGESTLLNATVYNGGRKNETNVELQLLIDGINVSSTTISELMTDSSYTINYLWTPTVEATYNITVYAPPVPEEDTTINNVKSAYVPVSSILVIFEEAHLPAYSIGSNPAADVPGGYAEFAKYLIASGYAVSTINPGTIIDPSVLASVNVLVIVAPLDSYSTSELDAIEYWVEGGGNLLLISDWDDFGLQANTIAARFGVSFSLDGILDSNEYVGDYTFWPYYDGANLRIHPITAGVNRVEMYAGDGIESAPLDEVPLILTDSDGTATWLSKGSLALGVSVMSAIKGGTAGSGKLVIITDCNIWDSAYDCDGDGEIDFYDSDNEILALNSINWLLIQREHELAVFLDAPTFLKPGDPSLLNATVYNFGLNNEIDVKLQILINSIEVSSTTIPELANGTSYTINYLWTPMVEATYNVTAYAPSVPEENYTYNNKVTRFVTVAHPLICPIEGQWANYTFSEKYDTTTYTGEWNFTYVHYISPYLINVTMWYKHSLGYSETSWMTVNILNRYVESGAWAGMWYLGWIETNITLGSTINLSDGQATVVGSEIIEVGVRSIECWKLILEEYWVNYTFWYDKASGLLIRMEISGYYSMNLMLVATNIPIGVIYGHELLVTLDAPTLFEPGEPSLLSATVYNFGLNNETDVKLQILINSIEVSSTTIPELANGASYTINYQWTPPLKAIEAIYNLTAYAPPVSGENVTANNVYFVNARVLPDNLPPVIFITEPESNAIIASVNVTVKWTGVDDYGIANYSIRLNGVPVASTNATTTSYELSNLIEGSHTVTVTAYDKAGNSASKRVSFTVDFTPPSLNITFPEEGYATKETTVISNWTASDGNGTGIAYYLVYLDGVQMPKTTGTSYTLSSLIEGDHKIMVEAYDLAGNLKSDEVTITVDKTEPTLTVISPENGTNVAGYVTIRFLAFDTNLLRIVYSINGGTPVETVDETSFVINTTTLTDGAFNISITAIDKAENSATETITLISDNTAPTVAITSPKEGTELIGTVTIELNASDINLDKVLLFIDNAEFNITGTTSYSWDTTVVGDGNHKIRLLATDKAGNSAETSVTVNVVNVRRMITQITITYLGIGLSIFLAIIAVTVYAFIRQQPHKK